MKSNILGKQYKNGEIIIRQNEIGNSMYVVQSGQVEVFQELNDKEIIFDTLNEGDFFGEMSIFEKEVRSASVRAKGDVSILTIDKKNLLKRIHEDPSLAFHIIQIMSKRLRALDNKHTRITANDRRNWNTRPDNL